MFLRDQCVTACRIGEIVEHFFYLGVQLFTDSGCLEMLQDTEGGPECVLRGTACSDRPCDKII